ncbi:hypothetical protein [Actinosynnema sp. NPDC023587]
MKSVRALVVVVLACDAGEDGDVEGLRRVGVERPVAIGAGDASTR